MPLSHPLLTVFSPDARHAVDGTKRLPDADLQLRSKELVSYELRLSNPDAPVIVAWKPRVYTEQIRVVGDRSPLLDGLFIVGRFDTFNARRHG